MAGSYFVKAGENGCKHYAKSCSIREVVRPAQELGRERVRRLLGRLAEDQCAKTRKDFEQRHLWNAESLKPPGTGINERQTEDVVSNCADESAECANQDSATKTAIAVCVIERCNAIKERGRGEEDGVEKSPHADQMVHLGQQAPDRRRGEDEDQHPTGCGPLQNGRKSWGFGAGGAHDVII